MLDNKQILNADSKLILASRSPRRKTLLEMLGLNFDIVPADIDEEINQNIKPAKYVMQLAEMKAVKVSQEFPNAYVLGVDTTVFKSGLYLNKPLNEQDAKNMLLSLSGNKHYVYSGISIVNKEKELKITKFKKTKVYFRKLENNEIESYIETGSPMDKAGAYGIQDDYGAVFVKKISGCYYNIVGLPVELFYKTFKQILK